MAELELTDEEKANGWTEKTLTAYIAEREKAQAAPDTTPKTAPPARNKASGKYLLPLDIKDE